MLRVCLRVLVLAASMAATAAFSATALRDFQSSQPLDAYETSVLARAERFAHRQAAYPEPPSRPEPSLMPGLPLAASALGGEFGPGAREVRLLALSVLGVLALLVGLAVRLEVGSWTLAAASASFVLVGHGFLGGSPAAARPETAMLVLAVGGFLLLRVTAGSGGALLAALPLGLAPFVDLRGLWFLAAAYLALALEDRRQMTAFLVVAGALVAGGHLLLSRALGPWFNYNAWELPLAALRPSAVEWIRFLGSGLLGLLGIWSVGAVLSCAMPAQQWYGKNGLWMCFWVGALGAGLVATQSGAAMAQAILPALVALSVLGPVAMQRVAQHLTAWPGSDRHAGDGVVLTAAAMQFVIFLSFVPPQRWIP